MNAGRKQLDSEIAVCFSTQRRSEEAGVLLASCVRDLLKKHGLPPCPLRKGLSWKQFIQSHLDVTWATDFFTEEVWTSCGLVTYYALFFIHLRTRRVHFGLLHTPA